MTEKTDYYTSNAISQSEIKKFIESPELYRLYKSGVRDEPTDSMKFGSLVDLLIFDRAKFEETYYVIPKGTETRKNTTIGKKFWEDIAIKEPNKIIIKEEDTLEAELMIMELEKNIHSNNFLFSEAYDFATSQLEISYIDVATGLTLKAKPDRVILKDNVITIIDYKTTSSPSIYDFKYSVKKYGYNIQESFYREAVKNHFRELGLFNEFTVINFVFIVQYNKAPYHVVPVELDPSDVEKGYIKWREALDKIAFCILTNTWTQYELLCAEEGILKLKCLDDRYDN